MTDRRFEAGADNKPEASLLQAAVAGTALVIRGGKQLGSFKAQRANNNLDVALYRDRLYLAWRTAPTHFASPRTRISVVSAPVRELVQWVTEHLGPERPAFVDTSGSHPHRLQPSARGSQGPSTFPPCELELSWRDELDLALGADLREPRFVVYGGKLHFYFFEAGTKPWTFEPRRVLHVACDPSGWSEISEVFGKGTVLWRARVVGDRILASIYTGGDGAYSWRAEATSVHLVASRDGLSFETLWEGEANKAVHAGGSEADFLPIAQSPNGEGWSVAWDSSTGLLRETRHFLFVVRIEGPAGGWGGEAFVFDSVEKKIVDSWWFAHKPDSPLLFIGPGGHPYLIARRSLGPPYDLAAVLPPLRLLGPVERTHLCRLGWWITPKRTSIYRIGLTDRSGVPAISNVERILDLPSAGDTCFPAVLPAYSLQAAEGSTAGAGASNSFRTEQPLWPIPGEVFLVFDYSTPVREDRLGALRALFPWVVGQLSPTSVFLHLVSVRSGG